MKRTLNGNETGSITFITYGTEKIQMHQRVEMIAALGWKGVRVPLRRQARQRG